MDSQRNAVLRWIINMLRLFALVALLTATAIGQVPPDPARAQNASPLAGVWTLNRSLSEFPPDIGFNPSWLTPQTGGGQSAAPTGGGGGRGRRGSTGGGGAGGAPAFPTRQVSYEDSRRVQLITAE